jgi:hypothetical protein
MEKRSDQLEKGEKYETLELRVSKNLNQQFLKALDCNDNFYESIIHPGLILNFCSITQSPSFSLEKDISAVGAKFQSVFLKPLEVNSRLTIDWTVLDHYERRSRKYQVCEVSVMHNGSLIMERKITNTFIGVVYLERRVKWEKETAYRRSVPLSEFPDQGYEIVGKKKQLTIEQLRLYSGGIPGLGWPVRNIHTDREISIRSGIGRPVASGMMFEAYLVELLKSFFGDRFFHGGTNRVIAIDMAGDGDSVIPKMVLKNYSIDNTGNEILADIWCENQYGNRIMIGKASIPDA